MFVKIFFSILIALLISSNSNPQNKCKILSLVGLGVDVIPSRNDVTQMDIEMINMLKRKLQESNLKYSEDPLEKEIEFLISTKSADNKEKFIISVLVFEKPPKEMIEVGVEGDVLYKVIGEDKVNDISADSKKIRAIMNADYLRNFGKITDSYIEEIDLLEAELFFDKVIKEFVGEEKGTG